MERTERFYRIDQLLNDRSVVAMKVFLRELEVSPATIKRDLEYLRSRFQAPIAWNAERRGYCYTEPPPGQPRFTLPGLWLTADEIQALLLMEDLLVQLQPGLLRRRLAPMRSRLEALLDSGRIKDSELRRRIRILRMPARIVEAKQFQIVCSATLSRKLLHLVYYSRLNNETTRRDVSPQRLVYYRANWYLDAWCHLRKALRSFAVDEIREARILPTAAREIRDAVLDAHLGAGYGIYSGRPRCTAVLRFTPEAARWVARETWHAQQVQSYGADGCLTLKVPYSNDQELLMDILRHGANVEVLQPASLRAKTENALNEALHNYRRAQHEPPAGLPGA